MVENIFESLHPRLSSVHQLKILFAMDRSLEIIYLNQYENYHTSECLYDSSIFYEFSSF